MTGKLIVAADNTASKLNVGNAISGTSPTTTVNGDIWITSGNRLAYRSNSTIYNTAQTNLQNSFNQPQIISTSSTSSALRVTQTGTGESFRVEDETSPDSTAFVISNLGRVGIGTAPDATVGLKLDSTGVKFSDGTVLTTAAKIGQEVRSDFVTDTSYIGIAPNGSAESANVWTIYRIVIDSDGNITSTTEANNVAWDDRYTATYA
jgi:hypothetical protein